MKPVTVLKWMMLLMLAHLIFYCFTGLALWAPVQAGEFVRPFVLVVLHIGVLAIGGAAWMVGDFD